MAIPFRRRALLGGALGGLLTLASNRQAWAWTAAPAGRAKRCVLLWMNGGPSQFETFDPKPGTDTGGPTQSIATRVAGVHLAENLPRMAERIDKLHVVRNVTSEEGEHERAQYYLHTGYRQTPAFPRPALGSVVSHEAAKTDAPNYVLMGDRAFGPAYCGLDHAAFVVGEIQATRQALARIERRGSDLDLLRSFNARFDQRRAEPAVMRRSSMIERIRNLGATPFAEALRTDSESAATRERYGESAFGTRCLTARRLLERGVSFVEVQLDGWDTHVNNFVAVKRLTEVLDRGWSALTDDLVAAGLWDDTLLVWMGDFGRTPAINAQSGRDHFPRVTPVVFSGGCVQGGVASGRTNATGAAIEGASHRVADVAATLLEGLGVAADQEFTTSFGSPTTATDSGVAIPGILAAR